MKRFFCISTMTALALLVEPSIAQQPTAKDTQAQTAQGSKSAQAAASAVATPKDFDKQYAEMQQQMANMQRQMNAIAQAKDPKQREKLLQEHWTAMQSAMATMHGMYGGQMGPGTMGGPMAGGMMGGGMMGGHMMGWPDYKNLTPEQLKQRQYMMDRWMPMQQMMMDQMMQHQHWMMQPPASPKP